MKTVLALATFVAVLFFLAVSPARGEDIIWGEGRFDPGCADFQGFVFELLNGEHFPVKDAVVTSGSESATTDERGYFRIPFGGSVGTIRVTKDGYLPAEMSFDPDTRLWCFTLNRESPHRATVGTTPQTFQFPKEGIEGYARGPGVSGEIITQSGTFTVGVTVHQNPNGFHLGRHPQTGEGQFLYLSLGSWSVHADGLDPEDHIYVLPGSWIEIPAHDDFDPGIMPPDWDGTVPCVSWDFSAHTYQDEDWDPADQRWEWWNSDEQRWECSGWVTFDPVRWAWRFEGFTHLSDFKPVYTIPQDPKPRRYYAKKRPIPTGGDCRFTYLYGSDTITRWVMGRYQKTREEALRLLDNIRDGSGLSIHPRLTDPVKFEDPDNPGSYLKGWLIPANMGHSRDLTVTSTTLAGEYSESGWDIGGSAGVGPYMVSVPVVWHTLSGESQDHARTEVETFTDDLPALPYDTILCHFNLWEFSEARIFYLNSPVSGWMLEGRLLTVVQARIFTATTPYSYFTPGPGGTFNPSGSETPRDPPQDPPGRPPVKDPPGDTPSVGQDDPGQNVDHRKKPRTSDGGF